MTSNGGVRAQKTSRKSFFLHVGLISLVLQDEDVIESHFSRLFVHFRCCHGGFGDVSGKVKVPPCKKESPRFKTATREHNRVELTSSYFLQFLMLLQTYTKKLRKVHSYCAGTACRSHSPIIFRNELSSKAPERIASRCESIIGELNKFHHVARVVWVVGGLLKRKWKLDTFISRNMMFDLD